MASLLRLTCAAISQAHRMAVTPALRRPLWCGKLCGDSSRKAAKSTQKQAKGLTADAVAAVRGSLLAVKAGINPLAARDLAIVALMACASLCRSEEAGLDWDCLELCAMAPGASSSAARRPTVSASDPATDFQEAKNAIAPASDRPMKLSVSAVS